MDRLEFVSSITKKSRGVFLWVRLVIDILIDGNTDGNSKEELLKTLDSLPPRLGGRDGLYMRMMQNIKREYLPESKRLFQLVIDWAHDFQGPLDIITLFLAEPGHLEEDSERKLRAQNDKVLFQSWEESRPRWMDLQRRLKSRCGGLLEGTENVQFMHQTAKEFMSRNYLWNKIFYNSTGFISEMDLNLATLSGLIRRMKCCGEAALKSGNLQYLEIFNDSSGLDDEKLKIPPRGVELLKSAVTYAGHLGRHEHCDHYVELLDELDNAGGQLIRDWKDELPEPFRQTRIANASWIEFFLRSMPWGSSNSSSLRLKSFLELAILLPLGPYVEAKIRGKGIPQSQLQSLLLRATRRLVIQWRGSHGIQIWAQSNTSEMLIQEGADPNCRDTESGVAIASEEGWTGWTSLLQQSNELIQSEDDSDWFWEQWIRTVKVLLKYGADPTVRWYRPYDKKDGLSSTSFTPSSHHDHQSHMHQAPTPSTEISTPDSIINAVLAHKPEFEKELTEILELLSKAKANLRSVE